MTQQQIDEAREMFKDARLEALDTPENLDHALDRMIDEQTQQSDG